MSIELAQLHKIYTNNNYSPNVFYLNPFTEVLFTPNWAWPQKYIAQKKHTIKKPHPNSDNLKQKIKQWFQSIDIQSRINCLQINDNKFIQTLCYFLPHYNNNNLYNMKNRKCIKNIINQQHNAYVQKGLLTLIDNFQVTFLKQPILHLSKNSQKFLSNQLIKWMQIISHKKIFELANNSKVIKQSQHLEDNILWFSEHSFLALECFLVNQFEKAIVKGYFNRDRVMSNYLLDIKGFCMMERNNTRIKIASSELIGYPLKKAIQLTKKQIDTKFQQMKEIQQMYQQQKQQMIQMLIENQLQVGNSKDQQGKKKRRRVRRRNNNNNNNFDDGDKVVCQQVPNGNNNDKKQPQPQQKKNPIISQQRSNPISFSIDEFSVIQQKCDHLSQYHQTDTTFDRLLDNHQDILQEEEIKQKVVTMGDYDDVVAIEIEQSIRGIQNSQIKGSKEQCNNHSHYTLNQENNTVLNKTQPENTINSSKLPSSSTNIAKKKKSKKQKLTDTLHQQLIKSIRNNAFTQFIDTISIQSNNLYNYKLSAYQFIVFFISSLLPTTNITLFGSNAVGLSLASSDIDIMISNIRWGSISQVRQVLYHIGNQISKMGWVVDYRLILNAKVPVLKLFIDPKVDYFGHSPLKYTTQTNLHQSILIKADIIINIQGQQNIGCQSTLLMKQWLDDHPQLQRIILFFKYILWYYGLNENYRGGICSYCLFLMVVHCLFKQVLQSGNNSNNGVQNMSQNGTAFGNNNIINNKKTLLMLQDQNEGTYIIEILKYYSQIFDSKNDEISITKQLKISSQQSISIKEKQSKSMKQNTFLYSNSNNNYQQPQISNNNYLINKRNPILKIVDPINGEYIESSFSKFQQIQQLFSMILVQSMKLDNNHKQFLNNNIEINDQFHKLHMSLTTQGSSTGYNVISKNGQQTSDNKVKKVVKKVYTKIKKYQQLRYSVKDIVSIGFKIGIDNWMGTNNSNCYDSSNHFHL